MTGPVDPSGVLSRFLGWTVWGLLWLLAFILLVFLVVPLPGWGKAVAFGALVGCAVMDQRHWSTA